MSDPEIQHAYEEQNRRDYIANARFGSMVSIPLNLSCTVMDHFMYPARTWEFFKLRVACGVLTALIWFWFTRPNGGCHRRIFGVTWFMGPLLMILWMIYVVNDPFSPYYAGLNIILLAMGLISSWTHRQNLFITIFVLAMYVAVSLAMPTPPPWKYIINNTTFLFLTAAFVVLGSRASARERYNEFSLRWELDKNRRVVEESNRKLVELDQIKSRFFANISHELRTPLTLLIAPLESLITRFRSSLDAETQEVLQTMHANGMRLLKLINDLLDLVRMESGHMQVRQEPLQVTEFVHGLSSAARQVADDKRLKFETSVDPQLGTVLADRDKLEKILLNLVFNALKFTPAGGRVELRAEKQGEEMVLSVTDTGVGISEKNLPFVFDRFWQADDSSKRKYQGVGIGLALVKELTEIQGGKASVQSQEGKGTVFTVRLPYRQAEKGALAKPDRAAVAGEATNGTVSSEEWLVNLYRRAELFPARSVVQAGAPGASPVAAPAAAAPSGQRLKALVADDEPDLLRFLKSQLSRHYEVVECVNGQQAVEKAGESLPDIILLDMMMPEKDGLQACREIRANPLTRSVPIILLTARADEETKLAALGAGASDFLPKPFSTTELHVRIKNLVESYQFQRHLARQNTALESTIDQLKETEMQLVQTEKMASLGRMSAGIIHEINNPLNYATTGLYTLRNKAKYLVETQREEYTEVLKDVEEGIKRVKTIVSDLRTFSHPDAGQCDPVLVTDALAAALRFLSNEWRDRVQIETQIEAQQTIYANRSKLVQVLMNLLQNSLDAMKEKSFGDEQPTIQITGRVEDGISRLSIRDNGPGITKEHLDKIFDPFYTTKDVGAGMGLGLSICHRIIKESGGKITVKTEPGRFCEFALEFTAQK